MVREFTEYASLGDALDVLKRRATARPRREAVPLGRSFGRVLFDDVLARGDVPARDSAHMDGFAVRSPDLAGASPESPVRLRRLEGSPLGVVPREPLRKGEARAVLTGGFMPRGADAVVQAERVETIAQGEVSFSSPAEAGEWVYPRGRDVKRGERVLPSGRVLRGTDQVLLGSLHLDRVGVYRRPRVALLPTGSELSEEVRRPEPGKVTETHTFLLSRLVEGAGGVPVLLPIARDDSAEIARSVRAGLRVAEMVLTLAGSSVSETDLVEQAVGGPADAVVHGVKVHRGRVMGFALARGKAVIILPGPIQGAVNAFAVFAYPLIGAHLGRGFGPPPSVPAVLGGDWEAGRRNRDFAKVVYVKLDASGDELVAEASSGETENVAFLTRNDGYLLLGESVVALKKGERVRVHLLPGLSPSC